MNFSNPKTQKQEKHRRKNQINDSNLDDTNVKSADFGYCFKILNPYVVGSDKKNDNSLDFKNNKGFFYDFISGKKVLNLNECTKNNNDKFQLNAEIFNSNIAFSNQRTIK